MMRFARHHEEIYLSSRVKRSNLRSKNAGEKDCHVANAPRNDESANKDRLALLAMTNPLKKITALLMLLVMTLLINASPSFAADCIDPPAAASLHQESVSISVSDVGTWRATGLYVNLDKFLGINWSGSGVTAKPKRYRVMYRIDPRFEFPQVFIQKYNYNTNIYESDFMRYDSGGLMDYQNNHVLDQTARMQDYIAYFNFSGRDKIEVKRNEVVNIHLIDSAEYFGAGSENNAELGGSTNRPNIIYTHSAIDDNKIIYSEIGPFCAYGMPGTGACVLGNFGTFSNNPAEITQHSILLGKIDNNTFNIEKLNLNDCPNGANGMGNDPLCYYTKGRGMEIKLGGTIIKQVQDSFINSLDGSEDFFYHKADVNGALEFDTNWQITDMFLDSAQTNIAPSFMIDWLSLGYSSYGDINSSVNGINSAFFHFGRYLMYVEVGDSTSAVTTADLGNIELEYFISTTGAAPSATDTGVAAPMNYRGDASDDGWIWVRIKSADSALAGDVDVNLASYTGSSWFSDIIFTKLVEPVRDMVQTVSITLYEGLRTNQDLINVAYALLTIYVIIYALLFLMGSVQIRVSDLMTRIVKIIIVVIMFRPESWAFFNDYVFSAFDGGLNYLMHSATGITSSADNAFGFIDPILHKYTNKTIWQLLFNQMLQIGNGMFILAIMVMIGIITFLIAIIQVVVIYIVAFIGLSILISLAPIFILLILFGRTQNMFSNWLSLLFSYMLKPTILIIFFLMVDQIMGEILVETVVRACWDTLIDLGINIEYSQRGDTVSIPIPGVPDIKSYQPQLAAMDTPQDYLSPADNFMSILSASFLFYILSKMVKGLIDYADQITSYLTNVNPDVAPGKREGIGGGSGSGGKVLASMKGEASAITTRIKGGALAAGGAVGSGARKLRNSSYNRSLSKQEKSAADKIDYSKFRGVAGAAKSTGIMGAGDSDAKGFNDAKTEKPNRAAPTPKGKSGIMSASAKDGFKDTKSSSKPRSGAKKSKGLADKIIAKKPSGQGKIKKINKDFKEFKDAHNIGESGSGKIRKVDKEFKEFKDYKSKKDIASEKLDVRESKLIKAELDVQKEKQQLQTKINELKNIDNKDNVINAQSSGVMGTAESQGFKDADDYKNLSNEKREMNINDRSAKLRMEKQQVQVMKNEVKLLEKIKKLSGKVDDDK